MSRPFRIIVGNRAETIHGFHTRAEAESYVRYTYSGFENTIETTAEDLKSLGRPHKRHVCGRSYYSTGCPKKGCPVLIEEKEEELKTLKKRFHTYKKHVWILENVRIDAQGYIVDAEKAKKKTRVYVPTKKKTKDEANSAAISLRKFNEYAF